MCIDGLYRESGNLVAMTKAPVCYKDPEMDER